MKINSLDKILSNKIESQNFEDTIKNSIKFAKILKKNELKEKYALVLFKIKVTFFNFKSVISSVNELEKNESTDFFFLQKDLFNYFISMKTCYEYLEKFIKKSKQNISETDNSNETIVRKIRNKLIHEEILNLKITLKKYSQVQNTKRIGCRVLFNSIEIDEISSIQLIYENKSYEVKKFTEDIFYDFKKDIEEKLENLFKKLK